MKLKRFRVKDFRSVDDSGWIDSDNVTALIGTNEAGKTNLLLPLWKLNPAKGGEINPTADYPRKRYGEIRDMKKKPVFIEADFELSAELAQKISSLTNTPLDKISIVSISKNFSNEHSIKFPLAPIPAAIEKVVVIEAFDKISAEIQSQQALEGEEDFKIAVTACIESAKKTTTDFTEATLNAQKIGAIAKILSDLSLEKAHKRSVIAPIFGKLIDFLTEKKGSVSKLELGEWKEVKELVIKELPLFVYYSNYGNLDSEIYLPHVIDNLKRVASLGQKEEAKARTLKVLFEFVRLKPEEILELGKDFNPTPAQGAPTEVQIKAIAEKKKEREILLQSASTTLTQKFREWWKQGDYIFRFQADGDHFRIWVSDDKRPEPIELEGRSTGLQWFLSFYLIFLVESLDAHKGSILLLDEPGLSLHPLAQKDLSDFFKNLSITNQILYTTHSPFMVDSSHLDQVKAVYIKDDGTTVVSSDLRANASKNSQRSIYPVHAALGISISDTILQGCQVVVVEGPSDQIYLNSIKNFLIGNNKISPSLEMVFIPAGGVSGIKAVISIVCGATESLPFVVLDSDKSGQDLAKKLRDNFYSAEPQKVLSIDSFTDIAQSEIEDLWPGDFLGGIITKYLRGPEEDFSDTIKKGFPIVPQVEEYANKYGLSLAKGWKVEVSILAKKKLTQNPKAINSDSLEAKNWERLFLKILNQVPSEEPDPTVSKPIVSNNKIEGIK